MISRSQSLVEEMMRNVMTLLREVQNTKFDVFRGETHKQRRLPSNRCYRINEFLLFCINISVMKRTNFSIDKQLNYQVNLTSTFTFTQLLVQQQCPAVIAQNENVPSLPWHLVAVYTTHYIKPSEYRPR